MIAIDENALICDLAETYHIYDYRSLPAHLVATFSVGLREDARIWKKISGRRLSCTDAILARLYDRLNEFIYAILRIDGEPERMYPILEGLEKPDESKEQEEEKFVSYGSVDEFNEARKTILEGEL